MAEGRIKDPHGNQSDDYNFGYIQRINKYWPGEPRRKKVIPFYNPIVDNGNRKFNKNDIVKFEIGNGKINENVIGIADNVTLKEQARKRINWRPLRVFDNGEEQTLFTWEAVITYLVMNLICGVFWKTIGTNENQLLYVYLITFGFVFVYSILSLEWYPKPGFAVILKQILFSLILSIFIIATVAGITSLLGN